MKKKTEYWVEPNDGFSIGMYKGKTWYNNYGWSFARLKTLSKVKKMLAKYDNIIFKVEKVQIIKGKRWHYPEITMCHKRRNNEHTNG